MDLELSLTPRPVHPARRSRPHLPGLVQVPIVVTLAATLLLSGVWAVQRQSPPSSRVTITDSTGLILRLRHAGTVGELLARAEVPLSPDDAISVPLDTPVTPQTTIHITRAVPVTVHTPEETLLFATIAGDVGELKDHPVLAMSPFDRLEPGSGTPITPGLELTLVRVQVEDTPIERPIPPPVQFQEDTSLPRGHTQLVKAGEPGIQTLIQRKYFKNGVFSGEQLLEAAVLKDPTPEVRKVGVRSLSLSRSHMGSRALTMVSTAYEPGPVSCGIYADGRTATGKKAGYGIVAVDPRVIPLGTRVFVEGYGYAQAEDTGGAIKGMKIDVCFATVREALNWGRRTVKVYILDDNANIPALQDPLLAKPVEPSVVKNILSHKPAAKPTPKAAAPAPTATTAPAPVSITEPAPGVKKIVVHVGAPSPSESAAEPAVEEAPAEAPVNLLASGWWNEDNEAQSDDEDAAPK